MTTDRILLQHIIIVTAIIIIVVREEDRGKLIVYIFASLLVNKFNLLYTLNKPKDYVNMYEEFQRLRSILLHI